MKLPPDIKDILPPEKSRETDDIKKPLAAPSGELAAQIRAGAGLFQQFCLVCHGADGTGSTVRAAMPPIPNFTNRTWQRATPTAQLLVSIMEGKGTLMPANNSRITKAQARTLVAYIRAFGGSVEQPPPGKSDDQFEESFRKLQRQWDQLEKQVKKLKSPQDR